MWMMADEAADAPPSTSSEGEELVQRLCSVFRDLAEGRVEALEEIYELAAERIYGLALWKTGSPDDAADVLQDVMVKVALQGPRLAAVRNPRAWLLGVTRRRSLDLARRRRVREAQPIQETPFLVSQSLDPARGVDAARASALLSRLPAKQREAIYLRCFVDCSFAEIGEILGVPTFTAASRYRLGMEKLRRELGSR
jgi:RNA polymerase sigma-70 factor (ECF subfamily)